MTVAQLIAKLSELDPETVVVLHHDLHAPGSEGYKEVLFLDGTHQSAHFPASYGSRLKQNRRKFVKGKSRPDYLCAEPTSKAKLYAFVVLS
jgi:hypothetical protein